MRVLTIVFSLLITTGLFAQEVIDKIAAVVDNEVILKSEVDYQVNYVSAQRKLDPNDPALRKQILMGAAGK